MKKIFFPGVLLALLFIYSCTKDEFTEEKATQAQKDLISTQDSIDQVRDSLNMIGGIIQYSVSVIPVDGGTGFVDNYKSATKTDMLSEALVSVSQHGVVLKDSTDDSGMAVFYDLRVGTINVNVKAEGYTSVSFIAEIRPEDDPNVNVYYDVLRHAATMVPVFALDENTSTISGEVTYESNLLNQEPELAADVTVIARLDIDDSDFVENYLLAINGGTFDKYNAAIVQIAYADLIKSATTDANGIYTIDMPSAADGLPIILEIADVAINQQLLMNTKYDLPVYGIQNVRTYFSTDIGYTLSTIPTVSAAYAIFSEPTGIGTQQPLEKATATAIIGESGIAAITILNQGDGYTQAPLIEITTTGTGEGAEAVAYITEGKVTSIEITNPGKGYAQSDVITVTALDKPGSNASAAPVISYSVSSFTSTPGSGYMSTPDVIITSSSGSGASAQAIMTGSVSEVNVTNMGSGYICPPDVVFSASEGVDAKGTAKMTAYNSLHSIELSETYLNTTFFEMAPQALITTPGVGITGSGATAVVQLSTVGRVMEINLTNAGMGYTEAPTVLITGGGGTGAVAEATLNLDGSISISAMLAKGSGYTSIPTIEISAPAAGGIQAVAEALLEFPISSITLTNPGSGYNITYTGPGTYGNQPTLSFDGTGVAAGSVKFRPNMKVESIDFSSPGDTPGDGYDTPPTITIVPVCGYGSGATATTEILFSVASIEVVTPGSGYNYDADIEVTVVTPPEGCLTQATAAAVLGDGILSSINLTDGGENYLAPPNVVLTYPGTADKNATVEAQISNGSVTGFTIVDAGEGFAYSAPGNFGITISTKKTAVVLSPKAYTESGRISFATINNAGAGYTVVPMVQFLRTKDNSLTPADTSASSTGFKDAEATAIVEDGRVVAINITNPGTGYYYPPIVKIFVPDYLKVATAEVIVNADGYVQEVNVVDGGMGYSEVPVLTISPQVEGVGSGALATATINALGKVTGINLENSGSGYVSKNYPTGAGLPIVIKPNNTNSFTVFAGKSYIKDIYLGTGKRTVDN